ncbi:late competence development ComFB family protein [Desulfallas sp. Bu1-1]|jgi:competence protein ComFB|uniref:late competence development ComFB family protein n=1 Tax=Desulfallas sp. Bu1-1 TaxID=2787620 RepID=UPI00189DCA67|nr:late competence development ComFB family protein [Desulfallas sp. Bu1-1]MBF7083334.1 late competence development ComFB family protein [Desulfallas sp. Bu1-1]
MIINYPEVAVRELIDEVLENYKKKNPDICDCERCRNDIMALALNNLPVKYIVTEKGHIYTKAIFDQIGGKAQVIAALTAAIQKVHKFPRH